MKYVISVIFLPPLNTVCIIDSGKVLHFDWLGSMLHRLKVQNTARISANYFIFWSFQLSILSMTWKQHGLHAGFEVFLLDMAILVHNKYLLGCCLQH